MFHYGPYYQIKLVVVLRIALVVLQQTFVCLVTEDHPQVDKKYQEED
jgi:hypothetical protein